MSTDWDPSNNPTPQINITPALNAPDNGTNTGTTTSTHAANLTSNTTTSSNQDQPQHELQTQGAISAEELIDTITSSNISDRQRAFLDDDEYFNSGNMEEGEETTGNRSDLINDQPTMEQIQRVYYTKGLEELESLKLLDLSPLANWKLSSSKHGFSIGQLRDDTPDNYWQSDGSNGSNNANSGNSNGIITNNQLTNPHSITIQFSKKISLERISLFTNYNLDESYTPSKIKIMAGSSDGWDLSDVCTVDLNKPVGWSHIIFNGIRNDGVLKCFMIKIIILANHQDGKDTHIRALKCFGKKSFMTSNSYLSNNRNNNSLTNEEILKDLNLNSAISSSGLLLNNQLISGHISHDHSNRLKPFIGSINVTGINSSTDYTTNDDIENDGVIDNYPPIDKNSAKYLNNTANVIGFNTGFQSLELKSTSSIR